MTRADKAALYAGALAVVLPSWIEGYGYPPLEGFAHGTPAIVSDLPALRETAGGGARYVPAGDVDGLAAALRELAGDEELRRRLRRSRGSPSAVRGRRAPAPSARRSRRPPTRLPMTAGNEVVGAGFSVVVVLHDSEAELRVLLDSLEAHLAVPPELVVVDSGSRDGGAELARGRGAEVSCSTATRASARPATPASPRARRE